MTPEVFTAIDDVRACEVRGMDVLAATSGGLVRIAKDKVDHVWTVLDGLPDTKANALLVEGAGGKDVWVGTDRGLALFESGTSGLVFERAIASPPVRAIHRHAGVLYVGTYGAGVFRLPTADSTTLAKVPFAATNGPAGSLRITSLSTFESELVVGTAGAGVFRLHDGSLAPVEKAALVDLTTVFALAVRDDRLYVGGIAGMISLGKDGVAHGETESDVRAFSLVGEELWGAAYGQGVVRLGKTNALVAGIPPEAKWAQAIDVAPEGRCLGAANGLFVGKTGETWKNVTTFGLPSNDVNALVRDGDRIFAGTYDKGLAVLAGGVWKTITGPSLDDRINALATSKKAVWVGTTRGLVRLEGAQTNFVQTNFGVGSGLPSIDVHSIAALSSGGILVGTTKGAAIVDGSTVTPLAKKQGLVIDTAWAVAEGPSGMLLVGASTGLYVRVAKQSKWTRLSVMSGHLADDWVTSLAVHGNDVFVGTYSGGVSHLSLASDDVTKSLATQLGGGFVNLAGLTISGNSLYAATMDGLLVRSMASDVPGEWKRPAKVALGVDVTGVVVGADGLWVASRRGLVHTK